MAPPDVPLAGRARLAFPQMVELYPVCRWWGWTILGVMLIPHGFERLFLVGALPASRNFAWFGWADPMAWN